VTTEHHDYCALFPACFGNGGDDELEVACDQNVWQCAQKRGKAPIAARRRREFRSGDLVWSPLDRNGANLGEIGFRRLTGAASLRLCSRTFLRAGAAITAYGFGDGK
jgi:hypothetical protein